MAAVSVAIISQMRLGDICNNLPVARDIFLRTNEKPDWYVNLHFASIFGGVGYATPIKTQFAPDRTDLACDLAKQTHSSVLMMQTFGKMWHGKPTPCCYNRLAWTNCGMGDCFDKVLEYPLIFDRRDSEREARLCFRTITSRKPLMLISVSCGRSSPFPTHGTFADSIRRKWGQHFEIVDLCRVRAARIYDVVGLMDRAAILVTSDSAFVHLATASPRLPVILLHNDQPFLATSPRCHCILKMPYANWHARIREVHSAIESHL